ncbi:hypothetical protein [Pseudomonas sp.]|uniref:hypothetical protein n=1 Tax=Pseudomonas sp. TaxID=306 RepID=UPI00290B1482|nr:hypothetical protein [Pseudomonas sp.]MDU4253034.1 hypothetical protein [Pseudomonas sp.]
MTASRFPDPLQLCREALNKLENGINGFAARKMDSTEFAQAMTACTRASTGARYLAERSIARLLEQLDLPSRDEVRELADAVRRIEDKLDQLLPDVAPSAMVPRPPRSRRPLDLQPEQALSKARQRAKEPAAKAKRKP